MQLELKMWKLTKNSVKTDQKLVRMYKNSQNVSEYAKMFSNVSNGLLMHENYPILIKTGPSLNEIFKISEKKVFNFLRLV